MTAENENRPLLPGWRWEGDEATKGGALSVFVRDGQLEISGLRRAGHFAPVEIAEAVLAAYRRSLIVNHLRELAQPEQPLLPQPAPLEEAVKEIDSALSRAGKAIVGGIACGAMLLGTAALLTVAAGGFSMKVFLDLLGPLMISCGLVLGLVCVIHPVKEEGKELGVIEYIAFIVFCAGVISELAQLLS